MERMTDKMTIEVGNYYVMFFSLLQEECNVVCVDWEGGASMPNYLRAAANTRLVGKQLAMLLQGILARRPKLNKAMLSFTA